MLARATQTALEQEVINWVKVHPDDVRMPVRDIFIKLLQAKLP
ncbi:MAG: hypothetical protein ACLPUO_24405 [Streptosporangiaceae bacterium]|jgi:hypothetical protein